MSWGNVVEVLGRYSKNPHLWDMSRTVTLLDRVPDHKARSEALPATLSTTMPQRFKRRLGPEEVRQIVRDYESGLTSKQLSHQHGVNKGTILALLHHAGANVRRQGLQPEDVPLAAKLYQDGWSLARIGDRFDCDDSNVRTRLLEYGVETRPRLGR